MGERQSLFVVGASRNVGYAVANRFAREGYDVCLTSRSQSAADKAAREIGEMYPGVSVYGIALETCSVESIRAAFGRADELTGRIDALVCCATANRVGSIMEATPEQFDEMYQCNTRGYYFCVQEAARRMIKAGGGSMVLFSSLVSHRGAPNISLYAISKGGIDVLCRNAAYEFAKYGIRCNLLLSGPMSNDDWKKMSEEELERRRHILPAGRESSPDDAANCVWFLCSDEAATITGSEHIVDSGLNLSLRNYNPDWDVE